NAHIVPIFLARMTPRVFMLSHEGTGWLAADNLLVTCWHCVRKSPGENEAYVAAILPPGSTQHVSRVLENISQDLSGADLSTANIDHRAELRFELDDREAQHGSQVWTFGYPFTDVSRTDSGDLYFTMNPRRLQGYVTRPCVYNSTEFGKVDSYELDMPTPA